MGSYTDSDLMQLATKLKNEVGRLHPETNQRRGVLELVANEAEILLDLVQKARGIASTSQEGSML
jgi:hypothetical protein